MKESFERLLSGKSIVVEIDEQIIYSQLDLDESSIWSLLLASGYLKVENCEIQGTEYGEWKQQRFYHGFVLGLIVELTEKYSIISNRETGVSQTKGY